MKTETKSALMDKQMVIRAIKDSFYKLAPKTQAKNPVMLLVYSSAGGNNGSAFAGFAANTPFINVTLGLVMLFVRFIPILGILAIAGSMVQKKKVAVTAGTLSTCSPLFVFLLVFVVLLVGALSFFPALALGPIAEFFGMF